MLSRISRNLLPALALAIPVAAHAQTITDPDMIDAEVVRFTGAPQGSPGGAALPVDRRLKLAACRQPLALGWNGQRRDTVVVQCPDPGSWRLFVAVLSGPAAAPQQAAVTRGEAVSITVAGPGFSVSQPGEAMEAGPVGAWIRVRPVGRNEPLRARIVRPGLVEVPVQ